MQSYRISRLNPKSGLVEQPYRDKEGQFILADPIGRAQRHHAKYAVKVGTTAEAVTYLEKGFPIRMTDGQSAPSLVSARSVTFTPIDMEGEDESSLGSTSSRNPPLAKEAVMEELKQIICVLVGHIAFVAGNARAAEFIGFESESNYTADIDWKKINLKDFEIAESVNLAYDYAYQSGEYWKFDRWSNNFIQVFLAGIPRCNVHFETLTSLTENSLCRRICEMAEARLHLEGEEEEPLSIRQLSLLANITESATRTSLSREQRAAPDGMLSPEEAREWLRSRRGFVPTKLGVVIRKDKALFWSDQAFRQYGLAEGLRRLIWDWKETTPELVGVAAGVSKNFMAALMSGRPVLNIEALKRVGKALDVNVPQFVGLAVQEALKAGVEP